MSSLSHFSRSISSFAALGGPICVLVFSLRDWRFLCNAHVEHTNNHTYTLFRMYIIATFCRFVPEELEQWAISEVLASGGIMSSA